METLLTESLWGDEGFSAMAVQQPFLETMGIVMRDTAPPLFYVVGWIWGRMFGFSEVSLRSLSLLLMLGAAWFAYKIVAGISKDKLAAVAAGFLAFFSPFLTPFAFEWRMYALFAFLVTGSVYFFSARKWRGYVLFTSAALYTHHYAWFTVVGQGLWFGLSQFDWKSLRTFFRQIWPFWMVMILYLPWIYPMYLQVARVKGQGFWLSVPTFAEVLALLGRFAIGGIEGSFQFPVVMLVAILIIGKDWRRAAKRWMELLVIFLMPVVLAYAVSQVLIPIFYDRYLLSVVVGMGILVVIGIKKWAWPALVLLIGVYLYSSILLFTHPAKRPFRELASYIRSEQRVGDFLINHNGKAHHLWEAKYYGIDAPIYTPEGPLPLYVGTAQMKEGDTIEKFPEDVERLGVITSDPVENVLLGESWELGEVAEFGELKVLWFTHL